MTGYYRRFIKDYARVAKPLTDLLKSANEYPSQFNKEQLTAFQQLKDHLTSEPILQYPDWDLDFEIHTDGCKHGLGAVLVQIVNGTERVIQYASRVLREGELNYDQYKIEALALYWGVKQFHNFVTLRQFIIKVDNTALQSLMKVKEMPNGVVGRWMVYLQQFTFEIAQRKGKKHCNADGLSRNPLPDQADPSPEPQLEEARPLFASTPLPSLMVSSRWVRFNPCGVSLEVVAACHIPSGQRLGRFIGQALSRKDFLLKYPSWNIPTQVAALQDDSFLDPADNADWARYLKAAEPPTTSNVGLIESHGHVYVHTTQAVPIDTPLRLPQPKVADHGHAVYPTTVMQEGSPSTTPMQEGSPLRNRRGTRRICNKGR